MKREISLFVEVLPKRVERLQANANPKCTSVMPSLALILFWCHLDEHACVCIIIRLGTLDIWMSDSSCTFANLESGHRAVAAA